MKVFYTILVFIFFTSLIYSQQAYQDVLYLKNGDIVKGTIILNVANDYVKIQTENGSTITFKYSYIKKFTKEIIAKESLKDSSYSTNENKPDIPDLNTMNFRFGGRVGYFAPSERAFSRIYGSGITFGIDLMIISQNHFGASLSLDYFYKSANPTAGNAQNPSSRISVVPITLTGIFQVKTNGSFKPYFGIGGGIYFYTESLSAESNGNPMSASLSEIALGLHAETGLQIGISQTTYFLLSIKFSTATMKGQDEAAGSEFSVGGMTILGGILF